MKKLYFAGLLLLVLSIKTLAQSMADKPFVLNKLQQQDTLPTGWKMHAGNNQQWASPGFDDSKWGGFDPSQDVSVLSGKGSIFWLRLNFSIDSSLKTEDFAFMIYQSAASVVYLDGKLFKTFGTIAKDIRPYNPVGKPMPVKLMAGRHLIAVQFAVPEYLTRLPNVGDINTIFNLSINSYSAALINNEETRSGYQQTSTENLLLIGMFFILTVTHLVSYFYYRKQKAHLYYAVVTFILLFETYINIAVIGEHIPLMIFWLDVIGLAGFAGFVFLPLTIYALFGYSRRLAIKIILSFSVLALAFFWIHGAYAFYLFFYAVPLINAVECLRVGIWALRNKKSGALYIVAGSFLFLSLLAVQNLVPGNVGEALFMLSLISLPVGMTVFLAIRTAITYRSLETKLIEVQELSHQNMQFQLEKQQILADQNEKLEQQVNERTAALNRSLSSLKATQSQLIQSEKMASLGELTAGIAHEIQNPLNFVNNFSDVNREMLEELKAESERPKAERDDQLETELINDLIENEKKINHHGKRADGIVKGMLEHSRASTSQKELTDLNKLADEYLRLAYHGLRAKDKSFNAELVTNFDAKLPAVSVIPQDIGRVLLNLFNNAFYAVQQKQQNAGSDYKPAVQVTTFIPPPGDGGLGVSVKDNGTGIPDAIKDKIMQPFFTTKPTGQGTGLGLSLSYDIIVKGHGGNIMVNSNEGDGSEFILLLPVTK